MPNFPLEVCELTGDNVDKIVEASISACKKMYNIEIHCYTKQLDDETRERLYKEMQESLPTKIQAKL